MNNNVDDLIDALLRVKRCERAIEILKNASNNRLFKENILDEEKSRWAANIQGCIFEALDLIEQASVWYKD